MAVSLQGFINLNTVFLQLHAKQDSQSYILQ